MSDTNTKGKKKAVVIIIISAIVVVAAAVVIAVLFLNKGKLNESEKMIYDCILDYHDLTTYDKPETIKVRACSEVLHEEDEQARFYSSIGTKAGTGHRYFEISFESKSGNLLNDVFLIDTEGEDAGECQNIIGKDYYVPGENDKDVDIGKINNALKEHWEELGLN